MASLIPLRALRPMVFNGERLGRGARFFTSPIHAAALRYAGDADFETSEERAPVSVPETPPVTPTRRRVYKRRDLRPEE